MAEPIMKKRTLRCSDEDWNRLKSMADEESVSVSRFILKTVFEQPTVEHQLIWSADEQRMFLNYIRLLAFDHIDKLQANHSEEEVEMILDRARSRYRPLNLPLIADNERTQ